VTRQVTALRLARVEDAAAMSALHAAAFEEGWSEADFVTWLSRRHGFAIAAMREREAVAFGLALEAGDDAELLTIAVAQGERRQGWGRKIFEALENEANKRSLTRWVLEVRHNNLAAVALYKSLGFMEISVRKAYYRTKEGQADALVLARPVGVAGGHIAP
jgi:[ribosomal protein S18]-alanine N-acetyltransferase